jgi:hypothetical protein
MARRWLRLLLPATMLVIVFLLVKRTMALRQELMDVVPSGDPWTPIVESPTPTAPAWVEPVDGECPPTHPIKAKAGSGIFHPPGGANYARTQPDRCYADEAAAKADGFVKAKR